MKSFMVEGKHWEGEGNRERERFRCKDNDQLKKAELWRREREEQREENGKGGQRLGKERKSD